MSESSEDICGATGPAPQPERAKQRIGRTPRRLAVPILLFLLAVLSTAAGYQFAQMRFGRPSWLGGPTVVEAAPVPRRASAKAMDVEAISHLAPQQQAERLLELAIHDPDTSLGAIHNNLDSWRGHLKDTDQLFHIILAALESQDPRVRGAAVEIDLVANNLSKTPQSLTKLQKQIRNDPGGRSMALWRLGSLGNRGVEPGAALNTLTKYSQDANQLTRFWAVEGLAMLGTDESIDPLLSILAHDPAKQIRELAATDLSKSGMLTSEQRLSAVPQLLNLLDDDSIDEETQNLVYSSLGIITGASIGKNRGKWREWWAHHDRPEKRAHVPAGLTQA
jgi:HEAT repeats